MRSSTSPLLRRSAIAPVRSLGVEEEDTTADLFNLVVISPCQTFVSNDPDGADNVERTPCNITSFECAMEGTSTTMEDGTSGNTPPNVPSRVTVDFDYELWYTERYDLNTTLMQLESSMLQHMAKVFDLLECPYVSTSGTATSKRKSGGGQRRLEVFGDELADLFVGVDSTPMDEPDDSVDECIVPVLATDKVQAVCQPMKGHFTASVNADVSQDTLAEASIKSGLLRLLRLGMNENLYVLNDVRKVSFIGDRTTYVAAPAPPAQDASGNGGVGTAALAVIILSAIFVFLIGGFLVGRSVKKRKQERQAKGVMLDESLVLEEGTAVGASYNKGFTGAGSTSPNGADVDGSLASTDELALQPQGFVQPVLTKSGESDDLTGDGESSTTSAVTSEDSQASPETSSSSSTKDGSSKPSKSAADELAAALLLATAAAASAEKAGEEVTGEKVGRKPVDPKTSPRKRKKKRKTGRRLPNAAPDSPDSLLVESLRKLDSIAEEGEATVIDESAEDTSTRSIS